MLLLEFTKANEFPKLICTVCRMACVTVTLEAVDVPLRVALVSTGFVNELFTPLPPLVWMPFPPPLMAGNICDGLMDVMALLGIEVSKAPEPLNPACATTEPLVLMSLVSVPTTSNVFEPFNTLGFVLWPKVKYTFVADPPDPDPPEAMAGE
jgi:hypothetical protein